jgi:hypothetical protein
VQLQQQLQPSARFFSINRALFSHSTCRCQLPTALLTTVYKVHSWYAASR